jgi:hypothetical protein
MAVPTAIECRSEPGCRRLRAENYGDFLNQFLCDGNHRPGIRASRRIVMTEHSPLPADLAAAHAMILAERAARLAAEAAVTGARLEIERLKPLLAKVRREQYGQSSERGATIIAQLELVRQRRCRTAELEETAAQEETAAEITAPASMRGERAPSARKPARRPLPEHLPRERIVYPAPSGPRPDPPAGCQQS